FYRHENLLRTLAEGLGLGFPGSSIYVSSMAEFFGPNTSVGAITGHVTDRTTGAAISGATVSSSGGSTVTDATGTYTLSNVPTGSPSVTASRNGYIARTSSVTVTSGATATLDFQLDPGSTSSPGTISGRVTNLANGVALSGATISFSG